MSFVYSFQHRIKEVKKEGKLDYKQYHFNLVKDGEIFDPEQGSGPSEQSKKHLLAHYYDSLCKGLDFKQKSVVVRLSWFGYDVGELTKRYCGSASTQGFNLILGYHHWPAKPPHSTDEGFQMMLECNKSLLKELFDEYWFQVLDEKKMEIISIDKKRISKLLEMSRISSDKKSNSELVRLADYVLDNSHCGFHFYLKSKKAPPRALQKAFQREIHI